MTEAPPHDPDCPCASCVEAWGEYRGRPGERSAWVPSGWVLIDGAWRIPWGVGNDGYEAREQRRELATRIALARDLRSVGFRDR